MNVKLSRKQELYLISVGLDTLLSNIGVSTGTKKFVPWNKGLKTAKKKRGWTAERRKRFSETMRKKWANK